ncbi:hypothetical protein PISMIDRAFT_183776 [Pisolithus microcarpus 441]|uniref:Uncharacterized protein n=1 Tax=Pisolithus microcarpus 441 TaxID=765257 RepID=A0A0C9ZDI9_9AGAM|nr:hypothetical protein PISMIDRAFT_183776 [Pisolithus microcarpus 441]
MSAKTSNLSRDASSNCMDRMFRHDKFKYCLPHRTSSSVCLCRGRSSVQLQISAKRPYLIFLRFRGSFTVLCKAVSTYPPLGLVHRRQLNCST